MPKETLAIAGALTVAVALMFLFLFSSGKKQELLQARADLEAARAVAATNAAVGEAIKAELAKAQARIEDLEEEQKSASQVQNTLEADMRTALESKDITISNLQGRLTVSIVDRILFDSGQAELKPGGQEVLRKVVAVLAQRPGLQLHVVGHTDNVPISPAARNRFPSNWELSTTRATAAVRFLIEQAGVDPARVGAVGYGEFRPLADNATAEGRARNRRIAIVVLPDEIAPADNGPVHSPPPTELPPVTAAPTNAPASVAPTNAPVEATPIEPADRPPAPGGN
jgi:chemotaxis protein MotB